MQVRSKVPQVAGEQKANHTQTTKNIVEQQQHKKNPPQLQGSSLIFFNFYVHLFSFLFNLDFTATICI
jgi:hypothetical protein